jgi:DNA-binding CsgD family transcriptional regulator
MINITKREKEVLKLFVSGNTTKEVASILHLSEHTIVSHRKNLICKLDARSSVQLGAKAVKLGIY